MTTERSHNLKESSKMRLLDIFSCAVHFKLTRDDLAERVRTQVLVPMKEKRAPYWVESYIQGVYDTKMAELYTHHIMWVVSCDGVLMTSKQVDALTAKETEDRFASLVERCEESVRLYAKNGGSCRHPPTREEFMQNLSRFAPSDYKSPWSRIDNDKSRHVWIDRDGTILYDKPFSGALGLKEWGILT